MICVRNINVICAWWHCESTKLTPRIILLLLLQQQQMQLLLLPPIVLLLLVLAIQLLLLPAILLLIPAILLLVEDKQGLTGRYLMYILSHRENLFKVLLGTFVFISLFWVGPIFRFEIQDARI
jgi:hypothetical protein